jgi:hypothetical protein
MSSM